MEGKRCLNLPTDIAIPEAFRDRVRFSQLRERILYSILSYAGNSPVWYLALMQM